jgi:hypothetical protein
MTGPGAGLMAAAPVGPGESAIHMPFGATDLAPSGPVVRDHPLRGIRGDTGGLNHSPTGPDRPLLGRLTTSDSQGAAADVSTPRDCAFDDTVREMVHKRLRAMSLVTIPQSA